MNFKLIQQALVALEMYREYTPEGTGVAEQAIVALKQFKKEWQETEVPYVVVECNCSDKTTLYSPPQPKQEQCEPDKYVMDIECTKCGAKQSGILTVNTTPQPAQKPLTDEQILEILGFHLDEGDDPWDWIEEIRDARKIEAAHGIKEKNSA